MRHQTTRTGLLLALLLAPCLGLAAVPKQARVEAVLTATGGGPVADGAYDIRFDLLASQQATKPVWSEGPVKLAVKGGRLSYALGASQPLDPAKLASLTAAWLRITVVGSPSLPAVQLAATPYALVADREKA